MGDQADLWLGFVADATTSLVPGLAWCKRLCSYSAVLSSRVVCGVLKGWKQVSGKGTWGRGVLRGECKLFPWVVVKERTNVLLCSDTRDSDDRAQTPGEATAQQRVVSPLSGPTESMSVLKQGVQKHGHLCRSDTVCCDPVAISKRQTLRDIPSQSQSIRIMCSQRQDVRVSIQTSSSNLESNTKAQGILISKSPR